MDAMGHSKEYAEAEAAVRDLSERMTDLDEEAVPLGLQAQVAQAKAALAQAREAERQTLLLEGIRKAVSDFAYQERCRPLR